jgi:hypothetical protein
MLLAQSLNPRSMPGVVTEWMDHVRRDGDHSPSNRNDPVCKALLTGDSKLAKELCAEAFSVFRLSGGGVVENLGLEGLRRYLTTGSPPPEPPDVLLISDASQYGAGIEFKRKPELLRLLARSQSLSYAALHRQLYARYTGHADIWTWSREEPLFSQVSMVRYDAIDTHLAQDTPERLMIVVIPITAPTPSQTIAAFSGCEFAPGQSIPAVQQRVSAFDTLSELEKSEAEAAYWLGYNLGLVYSNAIECARIRVTDPSHICTSSAGATTCRSLAELLPTK